MTINIGEIPRTMDWIPLRRRLSEMRAVLMDLQNRANPPRPVINLTATAKAGGVIIMFTRTDGTSYALYRNTTPNLNGATQIELGNTGYYVDDLGEAAITRYYWVLSRKGALQSSYVGPVNATTLALGAGITAPTPPIATDEMVYSDQSGYPVER
jgi:hypothetical protein